MFTRSKRSRALSWAAAWRLAVHVVETICYFSRCNVLFSVDDVLTYRIGVETRLQCTRICRWLINTFSNVNWFRFTCYLMPMVYLPQNFIELKSMPSPEILLNSLIKVGFARTFAWNFLFSLENRENSYIFFRVNFILVFASLSDFLAYN